MSPFKSCHRCAKPYDECVCHMFNPDGSEVPYKGLESAYDQPNAKSLEEMSSSDLGSHYHVSGIEPFDVIEDMGDLESFCRGNAIKYLMRYKHKGSPVQDLEKAKVYIDKLIEMEK